MPVELTSLIAIGGFLVALVGGVITRDRYMASQIQRGDSRLHERIDRIREDYVKREDLDGHIERLEKGVRDVREDLKEHSRETNRRLDTILSAIGSVHPRD